LHAKVKQAQVGDDRDCHYPNAIGDIAEAMQDEGGKKEPDRHAGDRSKPVK
jgi:hypothetical protein